MDVIKTETMEKAHKALEALGYIQIPEGKKLEFEVGDLVFQGEDQDFDDVEDVHHIVATGYRPTRTGGEVYYVLLHTGALGTQDDLQIVSEVRIVKGPLCFPDQTLLVPIGEGTIRLTVTEVTGSSGDWEYALEGTEDN